MPSLLHNNSALAGNRQQTVTFRSCSGLEDRVKRKDGFNPPDQFRSLSAGPDQRPALAGRAGSIAAAQDLCRALLSGRASRGLVTKEELLDAVWGGRCVSEG